MRTLLFFLALSIAAAQTAKDDIQHATETLRIREELLRKAQADVDDARLFLDLALRAQTAKVEVMEVEDTPGVTRSSALFAIYGQEEIELGGVTPTGKFYLITWKDGKRIEKPCSRPALIRAVERSDMETNLRAEALRSLGKPAGIIIYAPIRREK